MRNPFSIWQSQAVPFAVIVLMAIADASLNAFFFYPAILAAGGLVEPKTESAEYVIDCNGEGGVMSGSALEEVASKRPFDDL